MYWMKQSRQENLVYLVVWGLLFATPLLSLYVRTISDSEATFNWTEVFIVWRRFAVFLVLFLVHNFLLAPLLVLQRKRVIYVSIVAIVISRGRWNTSPWDTSRRWNRRTDISSHTSTSRHGLWMASVHRSTGLFLRCATAMPRLPSSASATFWPSLCSS